MGILDEFVKWVDLISNTIIGVLGFIYNIILGFINFIISPEQTTTNFFYFLIDLFMGFVSVNFLAFLIIEIIIIMLSIIKTFTVNSNLRFIEFFKYIGIYNYQLLLMLINIGRWFIEIVSKILDGFIKLASLIRQIFQV